jgi:hypothetical protein
VRWKLRQKRPAAAAGLPAKAPAAIRTTNDSSTEGAGLWLTPSFFYKLKVMNITLARRINQLAKEDQEMRSGHKKGVKLDANIDKRNTAELKDIIEEYGWPTILLVGKKASSNAWLLAQHADKDQKFQEDVLKLLKKIHKKTDGTDINPANIAYLTDRLLVKKGKKQQFGTQFDFNKIGRLILHPIKNPEAVDKLRKEYNLPPLKKFMKMADEFNAKLKDKK